MSREEETAPALRHEDSPALGRLPLAREDVDRGDAVRANPEWLNTIWGKPHTHIVYLHGGSVPVFNGQLVVVPSSGPLPEGVIYLGRSTQHQALANDADPHRPAELVLIRVPSREPSPSLRGARVAGGTSPTQNQVAWLGLRDVAAGLNDRDAGIFVEAVAIANWHARNKFCPRCGSTTKTTHSGWVQVCTDNGHELFPRTDPAVIVAITDDQDRILLGNNAAWGPTRYSTLAGFVEPGESLEAAVKREILEESHLVVTGVQYLGSQPWPFPQSLMLGFTAHATNPEGARADQDEIRSVRWFTREQLRQEAEKGQVSLPGSASIARALIEHWYGGTLPEPRILEN